MLLLAANFAAGMAMAKDGESGGGSGNSGSGSGNSGSGNGSSGDDDDGADDDESDSGDSHNGRRGDDHENALKAVRRGKAVSLQKLKDHLAAQYPGKILDVNLRRSSGDYFYNVRILAKGNRIKVFSLNALTLKPRGN
jgi:uncharacterized membrane protein YkoI